MRRGFSASRFCKGFGSNRQIAWMATNVAVAVAAQVLAGLVLYWSLGDGWVRKMAWLGVIPLTAALNVAYLVGDPCVVPHRSRHCGGEEFVDRTLFCSRGRTAADSNAGHTGLARSACVVGCPATRRA
jgi:hypothetical protein